MTWRLRLAFLLARFPSRFMHPGAVLQPRQKSFQPLQLLQLSCLLRALAGVSTRHPVVMSPTRAVSSPSHTAASASTSSGRKRCCGKKLPTPGNCIFSGEKLLRTCLVIPSIHGRLLRLSMILLVMSARPPRSLFCFLRPPMFLPDGVVSGYISCFRFDLMAVAF